MRVTQPIPILLLVLSSATATAQQAAPLGRLFMTPEWRAHLDRQRQLDIRETRNLEGGTIRLDGIVARSSGKSTVWVNGRPQSESERNTGVTVAISPRQPGQATLTAGDEPPANLKVGVTIDRATRETESGLAGGEIRINRARPGR